MALGQMGHDTHVKPIISSLFITRICQSNWKGIQETQADIDKSGIQDGEWKFP